MGIGDSTPAGDHLYPTPKQTQVPAQLRRVFVGVSLVAAVSLIFVAEPIWRAGVVLTIGTISILVGLWTLRGGAAAPAQRVSLISWLLVETSAAVMLIPQAVSILTNSPVAISWAVPWAGALVLSALLLRMISAGVTPARNVLVGLVALAGISLGMYEFVNRTGALERGGPPVVAAALSMIGVAVVAMYLVEPARTIADRVLLGGAVSAMTAVAVELGGLNQLGSTLFLLGIMLLAWAPAHSSVFIEDKVSSSTSTWRSWVVIAVSSLALPVSSLVMVTDRSDTNLRIISLGELVLVVALIVVITLMMRERLRHAGVVAEMAETDSLTGLPNRQRFLNEVDAALDSISPDTVAVTVVLVAMENYSELRSRLGQTTADDLQIAAAQRLLPAVPEVMAVAHLHDDVFGLLFDVMNYDRAEARAQKLVDVLREPLELSQLSMSVGAVVGMASSPSGVVDAERLVSDAELALTAARGKAGPVVRFTPELQRRDALAAQLVGELSDGIARGEVTVYFQPQLDLTTGQVNGAEGLVRWMHPSLGLLSPAAFVPAAEATGSIRQITLHVLDQSLYWCGRWMRAGHPINVSVNLSARDLLHARLVDDVREALARYGLPASRLELEITETAAMADMNRSQRVLTELARLGVTISIDDYGTGYGSLAYLQQLPVRRIKIDRSFVMRLLDDEASAAIIRSTIELAAQLGLDTIAEGVEDDATVQRLKEFGCGAVQGFGLAAPMSPEGFERAIWRLEHRQRPSIVSGSSGSRVPVVAPRVAARPVGEAAFPSVAQAFHEMTPNRQNADGPGPVPTGPQVVPAAKSPGTRAWSPPARPAAAKANAAAGAPLIPVPAAPTYSAPISAVSGVAAPADTGFDEGDSGLATQSPTELPPSRSGRSRRSIMRHGEGRAAEHLRVDSEPVMFVPTVVPDEIQGFRPVAQPPRLVPPPSPPAVPGVAAPENDATSKVRALEVLRPVSDDSDAVPQLTRRAMREARNRPPSPAAGSVGGLRAAATSERTTGVDPA